MIRRHVLYLLLLIACACTKNEEDTLPKRSPCEKIPVVTTPQYKYKYCSANMTYGYNDLGVSLADSGRLEHIYISIPDYYQFKKVYNGKKVSDVSLFAHMTLGLKSYHCNGCEPCGNQYVDYTAIGIKGFTLTDTTGLTTNSDFLSDKEYMYLSVVGATFVNLALKDTFYLDSIFVPKLRPGVVNGNI